MVIKSFQNLEEWKREFLNQANPSDPDTFPFTGRKSSALGTLSVSEALKTVSIESIVAVKDDAAGNEAMAVLGATDDCVQVSKVAVEVA